MEHDVHILLVEDNPDDALLLREMLSETEAHYHVQWVDRVSRGKHWLELNSTGTDLVLLDLFLPDSKGIATLLEFIKCTPDIPIVVLTGLDSEEIGRQAIKEGAQDYLCKNGLNLNQLENSLRFAIERHHLIMALKNKKTQLLESEQRFRHIIEKNIDGILILDRENRVIFMNPAAEKILGETVSALLQKPFIYPIAPGKNVELSIVKKDGDNSFIEMEVKEIPWQGETAFLASLRDISESKQLEKSLLIEKERLDITLRSIGDGVITTDKNHCIRLINPAAEKMTGCTQQQAAGQPLAAFLNLEFQVEPQQREVESSFGTSVMTLKGVEVMMDYSRAPITDKENRLLGYVYILRDTTMQKKMIEKMLKIQKLESLGVVAGILAHDFDNVFTVILGNIAIAKAQMEEKQRPYQMLVKSEKSALQAKELTKQLHIFSRIGSSSQDSTSLVKVLQEVVKNVLAGDRTDKSDKSARPARSARPAEMAEIAEPAVTCQWRIPADLWMVQFDSNQLSTALWNIVKNAEEAMPSGGLLEIRLDNLLVSEKMQLPLKSGSYVKISVKDHGAGMDKETLARIFDPFFTTKEKNKGMGLATAFSIIREHQGTIEVESQKNKGSIFSVFLPAVVSTSERRIKEEGEKPAAPKEEAL